MTLVRPHFTSAVVIAFVAFLASQPAAAQEPPVVKALLDSAALNATERPTYSAIDVGSDGTIRLKGLTMTLKGSPQPADAVRYEVEELSLAGVSERAPGKFEVAEMKWSGFTARLGNTAAAAFPLVTGRTVYVNQISAQPSDMERMLSSSVRGKEFVIPEGLVMVGGQTISIAAVTQTWDGDPDTGAGASEVEVGAIRLPGEMFKQADGKNPLADIGYDGLEFGMAGKALMTLTGEVMGFDFEARFTGKDVGAIVMNLAAEGIPVSMFAALSSGDPNLDKLAQQAQAMSIRRAKIRFEDASVTKRLLAMAAKAQGTDEATVIGNATGAAQATLSQMNAPQLASQTTAAIASFLQNPRSITLNLAPAQPVLGAQLMQAAQNPATLIQMLAITVTAND